MKELINKLVSNSEKTKNIGNQPIKTAVLLAAGMGKRLKPISDDTPKCLTKVNGIGMLGRLVDNLNAHNFEKLIVIVGHYHKQIRSYLNDHKGHLSVEFVYCPDYRTTNNIVSLWTAREQINEPFILFESDLVFNHSLLDDLLIPGRLAVSEMLPWMNGTTVTINAEDPDQITSFNLGRDALNPTTSEFKTVNIYSFSRDQWDLIAKRLDDVVTSGRTQEYYESVFGDLVNEGKLEMNPVYFDKELWYEIDTVADLEEAEKLIDKNKDKFMAA